MLNTDYKEENMDKKVLWKITVISGAVQWFFIGLVYIFRKTNSRLFSTALIMDTNAQAIVEAPARPFISQIPFFPLSLILGLITLVWSILFLSKWKENKAGQNIFALAINIPFILIIFFLILFSMLFQSWSGASLGST